MSLGSHPPVPNPHIGLATRRKGTLRPVRRVDRTFNLRPGRRFGLEPLCHLDLTRLSRLPPTDSPDCQKALYAPYAEWIGHSICVLGAGSDLSRYVTWISPACPESPHRTRDASKRHSTPRTPSG